MLSPSLRYARRGLGWFVAGAAAASAAAGVWVQRQLALVPSAISRTWIVVSPRSDADDQVQTAGSASPDYLPGRALVRFKDRGFDTPRLNADLRPITSGGVREVMNQDTRDITLTFSPAVPVWKVVGALKRDPAVAFAEPDGVYHAFYTPNDPYYDEPYDATGGRLTQWFLPKVGAPEAWEKLKPVRSDIRLAIIDTGIDTTHPDLQNMIATNSKGEPVGKSFIPGEDSFLDDHGHGTHCAGIAEAETDNETGVAGVGFRAFKLVPAKSLDARGGGSWDTIAEAITWCADNGCRVESMSLGGSPYSQAIQDAINYAWEKGVVIVAAAGNSSTSRPSYPAGNNHVVAVSATDEKDHLTTFSNFGNPISVAAPGIRILSTMPTYDCAMTDGGLKKYYDGLAGTSMACPIVAGEVAALLAYQPSLTNSEAVERIEQTADNVNNVSQGGWDREMGHGRVNVASAILDRTRKATVGSLYGQVTDSDGNAVMSTVKCGGVTFKTRSDGMFRFANLKKGAYTVVAKTDQLKGEARVSVVPGADTNASVIVRGG